MIFNWSVPLTDREHCGGKANSIAPMWFRILSASFYRAPCPLNKHDLSGGSAWDRIPKLCDLESSTLPPPRVWQSQVSLVFVLTWWQNSSHACPCLLLLTTLPLLLALIFTATPSTRHLCGFWNRACVDCSFFLSLFVWCINLTPVHSYFL